jgi:predicted kinase
MTQLIVIIVTGLPCTGKTVLAKKIAQRFSLPFVNKDGIKELLFDHIGWKDREWSKKLSIASTYLLYYFLEAQLSAGKPVIVESNFDPEKSTQELKKLRAKYDFDPVQIRCICDGTVLYNRFIQRSESGIRHPGHVDQTNFAEFKELLLPGKVPPIDIGGTLIDVDTTDFQKINYTELFNRIRQKLDLSAEEVSL